MPPAAGAWAELRRRIGAALGPLTSRRHGWFYVSRRTAADWVRAGLEAAPLRAGVQGVALGDVPARYPAVKVHEVDAAVEVPEIPVAAGPHPHGVFGTLTRPGHARAQSVLVIPDGRVWGDVGAVGVDADHVVSSAEMTLWTTPPNLVRRYAEPHRAGAPRYLSGRTVVLLHGGSGNYAHFLLQALPRVDLIDRAIGLRTVDRFLVREDAPTFVREGLARFGVDLARVEWVPRDPPIHYRCEELVAGTWLESSYVSTPAVVGTLRARFAAELDRPADRRWYLARGQSRRRTVNGDALEAALATRGFECLLMDGRTLAEQAELLASAACVVGDHGAALANLVFAPPGTPVVELMPSNTRNPIYARVAFAAALPYDVVLGTEATLPRRLRRFLIDADMVVDVDVVLARVDAALADLPG